MTLKTPTWLLERVAQDELDALEVEQIRDRMASEGRSMDEELAALRQSDREILTQLPRDVMGAAIRQREARTEVPRKQPRARGLFLFLPLTALGSVAVAVLVLRGPTGRVTAPATPSSNAEEIGIKGEALRSPRLLVYRQKPGQAPGLAGSERLSNGARAARGDLLQLAYDKAPEGLYGVLLSIDGAGRVTQHLPDEGARSSAPLTSVREIRLPSAYELDDAPDFERFVLITSAQPFPIAVALDALRALASHGPAARKLPLELSPAYSQISVLVDKPSQGVRP